MTSSQETPAVFQPNDPELQAAAEASLGNHYEVAEGHIAMTGGRNMNSHFNTGVEYGPWVAPGTGKEYTSYVQGLPQVEADAAAEDVVKAQHITGNAYPMRPVGEGEVVLHALEKRAVETVQGAKQ